jgi:alkylhydroperoxidase family enzyme
MPRLDRPRIAPLSDEQIDPDTRTLLRAADELVRDHFLSNATWQALATERSTEQLVDLVFAVGQYTLVSMALNRFGVQLDDGVEGFATTAR